jgi:hypothetical protein
MISICPIFVRHSHSQSNSAKKFFIGGGGQISELIGPCNEQSQNRNGLSWVENFLPIIHAQDVEYPVCVAVQYWGLECVAFFLQQRLVD